MLRVISQTPHVDGTITVVAENFINSVQAATLAGATVTGTVTVGPHDSMPGSEARIEINLTVTPGA